VTWLLPPELEDGEEPELKPPEELELELEPPESELEPVESELEPVEPEDVEALAVFVDPGRARANAPAAATLATVTAVVAVLTFPRPRSLTAIARRTPSSFVSLMSFSLDSRGPNSLREPSL
jgi:hypothetical protein